MKFIDIYTECCYYSWLNMLSVGFGELYTESLASRIVALI